MGNNLSTPILIPVEPEQFWEQLRSIVREEVKKINTLHPETPEEETSGPKEPLYKIAELCRLFGVSRPTVYEWIKLGKLKPLKIRSRVFFLRSEMAKLISGEV